ncbi:colicin E3/pyocin S6 family cytotoxin [Sporomusa malonica]|uniref:colicin E3/pyocin S6 family cytotoxin n=1 Tax=Sporomusa malonica TaxID=112901 RepID=UPI003CCBC5A8
MFNVQKQESVVWKSFDSVRGTDRKSAGFGRDKRYYEWDHTHNDIEVYDNKGRHLGSMNPETGEMYKSKVEGRKIDI